MYKGTKGSNRGRYESEEPGGNEPWNENEEQQQYPDHESSRWTASNNKYPYPLQASSAADSTSDGEERYTPTPSGGSGYAEERKEASTFEEEDYVGFGSRGRQHTTSRSSSTAYGFSCTGEGCSQTFSRASDRDRHFRTMHANNGERPHRCEVPGCQADVTTWTRADKLKQHNKYWHGPYECPVYGCSRGRRNGFGSKGELDAHRDEVHREYDQGYGDPSFSGYTNFAYGTSSGWSASTSTGPLATFDQPSSQASYLHAGGYSFSQRDAPGSMKPQSDMQLEDIVTRMSETAITDEMVNDKLVNSSRLDKRLYKLQNSSFFKQGRVIKLAWSEPKGSNGTDVSEDESSSSKSSKIYTKNRRFIVIDEKEGHCICLPVLTYGGQGVLKAGVHPFQHAALRMQGKPVKLLRGEEERGLIREELEIVMDSPTEKLHPTSRLNYAKIYTIEYNVKVCSVGRVSRHSLQVLLRAYNEIHPPLRVQGSSSHTPPSDPSGGNYHDHPFTAHSTHSMEPYKDSAPARHHPPFSHNETQQYKPYDIPFNPSNPGYQLGPAQDHEPSRTFYTTQNYPPTPHNSTSMSSYVSNPSQQGSDSYHIPATFGHQNLQSPHWEDQYGSNRAYRTSTTPPPKKDRPRDYSSKSYDDEEANDLYEA